MKHFLLLLLALALPTFSYAQTYTPSDSVKIAVDPSDSTRTREVYCLILGKATNMLGLGSKCVVEVDFGEGQDIWRGGMDNTLVDENGKAIKFNSMVDALNYMTQFGWKFVDAYAITMSPNNHVYHWLLRKEVAIDETGREGINQVRDKKSKKGKKEKKEKTRSKFDDPIY